MVVGSVHQNFWSHVHRCAACCLKDGIFASVTFRKAHICKLELEISDLCPRPLPLNENIFEFNVSVHQIALIVHEAQTSKHVSNYVPSVFLAESPSPLTHELL